MQSSYKTCPRCGLTLASDATICGRCGNRFTVAAAPIAPPPLLPMQPPGALAPQPPLPLPPPSPPERKQKAVAISLALGLGGIGVHGFYLGNKAMGSTLATMCVGGGIVGFLFLVLALAKAAPMWMTAIGLAPMVISMTIPLIQAVRYGLANPEQFQQWYVVEKRWF